MTHEVTNSTLGAGKKKSVVAAARAAVGRRVGPERAVPVEDQRDGSRD
jgi:hypothetical protein